MVIWEFYERMSRLWPPKLNLLFFADHCAIVSIAGVILIGQLTFSFIWNFPFVFSDYSLMFISTFNIVVASGLRSVVVDTGR